MTGDQLNFFTKLLVGDQGEYTACMNFEKQLKHLHYLYACVDTLYFISSKKPNTTLSRIKRAVETNRMLMYACSRELYEHKDKKMSDYSAEWEYYNNHFAEVTKDSVQSLFKDVYGMVTRDKRLFDKKYDHPVIISLYDDYLNYLKLAANNFYKEFKDAV